MLNRFCCSATPIWRWRKQRFVMMRVSASRSSYAIRTMLVWKGNPWTLHLWYSTVMAPIASRWCWRKARGRTPYLLIASSATSWAYSGYVLCPSIRDFESEFSKIVLFGVKHLRVWSQSVSRHDSEECSLWLKPSNQKLPPGSSLVNTCKACRLLFRSLVAIKVRALEASPGHKEGKINPSSNYPLRYLSSASQTKRTVKGSIKLRQVRHTCFLYSHLLFYVPSLCSSLDPLSSSLTHSYQVSSSETRPVCQLLYYLLYLRRCGEFWSSWTTYDMQLSQQ